MKFAKIKKIISLFAALCLLVGTMTACSGDTGTSDSTTTTGDYSETVTIQVNVTDTDLQDMENDPRYAIIQEKFNVEFELITCSLNDIEEKSRLWIGSDDVPDVFWTTNGLDELKEWTESGVLQALPSLDAYPNLSAQQEDAADLNEVLVDSEGNTYFIPTLRDTQDIDFAATQCFIYRKDWAEELGMYQESYTWDEMIELALAFVEYDPGENGAGNTVGIVTRGWATTGGSIGVTQSNGNWDTFYVEDGEYVWGPAQESTLEGIVAAWEMAQSGALWEEQTIASAADGPAKFYAGLAGICYDNYNPNNISALVLGFAEAYPDIDPLDAFEVMNVTGPTGEDVRIVSTEYWGTISFARDTSDEVIDRVLAIMDYMVSDEGLMLQQYGVEGTDYELTEDGSVNMLWEVDDSGTYVSPYTVNSDRLLNWAQLCEYGKAFVEYTDPVVSELTSQVAVQVTSGDDYIENTIDYAKDTFTSDTYDSFNPDVSSKFIELIMTSTDIEADWTAWVSTYQEQADIICAEMTEALLD